MPKEENKTYKDGVTLIADAIRAEIRAEQAKQFSNNPSTVSNVSDITAQFSNSAKKQETTENKDTTKDTTDKLTNEDTSKESEDK